MIFHQKLHFNLSHMFNKVICLSIVKLDLHHKIKVCPLVGFFLSASAMNAMLHKHTEDMFQIHSRTNQ